MHLLSTSEPLRLVLSAVVVACAIAAARLAQRLHRQRRAGEITETSDRLRQLPALAPMPGRVMPAQVTLSVARACTPGGSLRPAIAVRWCPR